jgi:lysophospholipase L1-like esterase
MILIVGSVDSKTAKYHKKLNLPDSVLFTGSEVLCEEVYHTSLADCQDLTIHLKKFDKIYWAESDIQEFNNYKEYFITLDVIKHHTSGLDPFNIRPKKALIHNTENSIIFLGCSHTAGVGLENSRHNYAELVSKYFHSDAINLAQPSKGNFKSFEIFNQIDFFPRQKIVLQLTDIGRLQVFLKDDQSNITETQLYNLEDRAYLKVFNDKQLLYMMLDRLDLILKYARDLNLQLVFFNLGGNPDLDNSEENNFIRRTTEYYLRAYPEYVPDVLSQNIDRGTDGLHFGPHSHAIWAELITKKFQELYTE